MLTLLAFFVTSAAPAQDVAAKEQQDTSIHISTKDAYDRALRPLEMTRADTSNWSEVEISALNLSIAIAKHECDVRDSQALSGVELIYLSRLCAFGLDYPAVRAAAERYIAENEPKPMLSQAYASLIDAELHVNAESDALASALKMLVAVPYDALVAQTLNEAIEYMRFNYTEDALKLSLVRQPLILSKLRGALTADSANSESPSPDTSQVQPIHDLYADGIALAALQKLINAPTDAAKSVAALDAALPHLLPPDESLPIATARRRYALLGERLPDLSSLIHITNPSNTTKGHHPNRPERQLQIPAYGTVTALLLFPDWCAQCLRMAMKIPQSVFTVSNHQAFMYGLLSESPPIKSPDTHAAESNTTYTSVEGTRVLRNTPTVLVDGSLLDLFAATNFPYLVLTDSQGIVRVLQPVGADAINPGNIVDSAVACVGKYFSRPVAN
jgi:hypothetical protein